MTTTQLKLIATLAVVFAGSGALAGYNHLQREIGRRDLLLAQARAEGKAAQRAIDSLEKVYRVDTVRAWRTIRSVDTLTQTVESWKTDTLRVVEYVTRADSAIRACSAVLMTCEQRVGAERRGRLAAEEQARVLQQQMPGKFAPWRHRIEGALAGIAVGAILPRLVPR